MSLSIARPAALLRLCGLLCCSLVFGASNARAEDCPMQFLAGQIVFIDGPAEQVSLLRAGKRVPITLPTCIMSRDRLDASRVKAVKILTGEGLKLFGRDGDATVWIVPVGEAPSSGVWDTLNAAYAVLFHRTPPIVGVGRGGGCLESSAFGETSASSPPQPLAAFPAGPQRIETNIPVLMAAWKAGTGGQAVTVQLGRDDGTVLAKRRVCGGASAVLPLTPGILAAGAKIILSISGETGAPLIYPIEVVAPGTLPHPDTGGDAGWPYGAWLVVAGPLDARLDGFAWLATGANRSFAASRIRAAILSDESLR